MRREYEIFEKFPDGSTLWRASIVGCFEAHRKIQELAERSENQFFTMAIPTAEALPPKLVHSSPPPQVRIKSAAAG